MIGLIILSGLVGGMVINYLADVIPQRDSFAKPFCLHCGADQGWFAYFIRHQRCGYCQRSRSLRVWIVEALYVLLAVWLWYSPLAKLSFFPAFVLLVYLGFVFVMDLEHKEIVLSIVGFLLSTLAGYLMHGLIATVIGAAVGAAVMFILHLLGNLLAKFLAKRRGEILDEVALGLGDVYLSGVMGAVLGFPGIVAGLVFTIIIGGIVSAMVVVGMLLRKSYRAFTTIPYGPFMIVSIFLLIYLKDYIFK